MTRYLTLSRWSPLHGHFGIHPVYRIVPHSYNFCCNRYGWLQIMFKFFYTFLYQVTYMYAALSTANLWMPLSEHCDFPTCRLTPHMPYIAIHVYIFYIYIVFEVFNTHSPTALKRTNISWPCMANAQLHFSANVYQFKTTIQQCWGP